MILLKNWSFDVQPVYNNDNLVINTFVFKVCSKSVVDLVSIIISFPLDIVNVFFSFFFYKIEDIGRKKKTHFKNLLENLERNTMLIFSFYIFPSKFKGSSRSTRREEFQGLWKMARRCTKNGCWRLLCVILWNRI